MEEEVKVEYTPKTLDQIMSFAIENEVTITGGLLKSLPPSRSHQEKTPLENNLKSETDKKKATPEELINILKQRFMELRDTEERLSDQARNATAFFRDVVKVGNYDELDKRILETIILHSEVLAQTKNPFGNISFPKDRNPTDNEISNIIQTLDKELGNTNPYELNGTRYYFLTRACSCLVIILSYRAAEAILRPQLKTCSQEMQNRITNYLIAPIQRLPRIDLFVKDFLNLTHKLFEDKEHAATLSAIMLEKRIVNIIALINRFRGHVQDIASLIVTREKMKEKPENLPTTTSLFDSFYEIFLEEEEEKQEREKKQNQIEKERDEIRIAKTIVSLMTDEVTSAIKNEIITALNAGSKLPNNTSLVENKKSSSFPEKNEDFFRNKLLEALSKNPLYNNQKAMLENPTSKVNIIPSDTVTSRIPLQRSTTVASMSRQPGIDSKQTKAAIVPKTGTPRGPQNTGRALPPPPPKILQQPDISIQTQKSQQIDLKNPPPPPDEPPIPPHLLKETASNPPAKTTASPVTAPPKPAAVPPIKLDALKMPGQTQNQQFGQRSQRALPKIPVDTTKNIMLLTARESKSDNTSPPEVSQKKTTTVSRSNTVRNFTDKFEASPIIKNRSSPFSSSRQNNAPQEKNPNTTSYSSLKTTNRTSPASPFLFQPTVNTHDLLQKRSSVKELISKLYSTLAGDKDIGRIEDAKKRTLPEISFNKTQRILTISININNMSKVENVNIDLNKKPFSAMEKKSDEKGNLFFSFKNKEELTNFLNPLGVKINVDTLYEEIFDLYKINSSSSQTQLTNTTLSKIG